MNWAWFNRVIFVLGLVALFISTSLFISHSMQLELPCTNKEGCAKVASSKYAYALGIPVAAFGMVFDAAVLGYCLFRPRNGEEAVRRSSLYFWGACVLAFLVSAYLIMVANTEIGATCEWCLAHAAAVATILLVAAVEQVRLVAAESLAGPPIRERFYLGLAVIGAVVVTAGYGSFLKTGKTPTGKFETVRYEPSIVGKDTWSVGPKDAPLTIVEFGDFECEHCARAAQLVAGILKKNPKTVRHVYRHCPLYEIHHNAMNLALAAEWAGQKDKFWQLHEVIFADQKPGKMGKFLSYATRAGLDATAMQKFLAEDIKNKKTAKYRAFMRVYADYLDAKALHIDDTTPTVYVILAEPGRSQVTFMAQSIGGLKSILDRGEVQKYLAPNSY